MRKILAVILTALLISPSSELIFAQGKNPDGMFNLDILNFYSTEGTKSRVDVYIEIPFRNIEFKRSKTDKSSYVSKFDVNIDVKDKNGTVIYNNVSKEEITTKETKQEYLMQNAQILTRNLFLPPGDYKIIVSLFEQSTKKRTEIERDVTVQDFASSTLSLSDVMIVSRISTSAGKKMITPDVARNVSSIDTFYLFYYVYKNNDEMQIDVNCRILDEENKEVFSDRDLINVASGISNQNQVIMDVPTENLGYGKYTIEISATSGSNTAMERTTFENRSSEFPLPIKDIEVLIEQLQYIAKDDEINYMKDGKSDVEKQKRFLEFWKKKDPSPNTKRNEVMQEYYKRLLIANKLFSTTYTEGWRSDMGMVYIIFGEPNNVERHPYEMDTKPYEVWDYYEINKQFVFVDNTGFGDYRLITPIWDTFIYNR